MFLATAWFQVVKPIYKACRWAKWAVLQWGLKSWLVCKWGHGGGGVRTTLQQMKELPFGAWLVKLMGGGFSPSFSWEELKTKTELKWMSMTEQVEVPAQVAPMGLLTALQGLFPSRKHAAGEHARGRQAFQCQHTLALFSAKGWRGHYLLFSFKKNIRLIGEKTYIRTHIDLFLGSLVGFFPPFFT